MSIKSLFIPTNCSFQRSFTKGYKKDFQFMAKYKLKGCCNNYIQQQNNIYLVKILW